MSSGNKCNCLYRGNKCYYCDDGEKERIEKEFKQREAFDDFMWYEGANLYKLLQSISSSGMRLAGGDEEELHRILDEGSQFVYWRK